jgi:type I restriction enzyme S subunit
MSAALKPGYKQTEVGVIPEDWDVVPIGQVGECLIGLTYSPLDVRDFGTLVLRSSNIQNGRLAFDDNVFVDMEVPARAITRKNDILICVRNGSRQLIGKCAIIDDKTAGSAFGAFMSVLRSDSAKFLFFQFQSNIQKRQIDEVMGATINQITNKNMAAFKVIWPPTKAEQEAIAEVLSDADTLIESLEQLIAKKRHIKQGAMQELLRPKDGWCIKKLEDIADVIDPHPSHRAPTIVLNGIPFVGIGDLNENGDLIGTKIRTVDPSVFHEHLARYNLNEELIGLGRVASIGKVVKLKYTGANYTISPTLGVIKGTKVRRDYLLYALKSKAVADQFNRIMSGSTRSSVGMVVLRKLDIAMPVKETEQTNIATVLSDMDAEIVALETQLTKTRSLKQGMMHNLLTGRIRLQ